MLNKQFLVFLAPLFFSSFFFVSAHAQEKGFDDELVAGIATSYYGPKGVGIALIKNRLADFCDIKGKSFRARVVILRNGRVFFNRKSTWFALDFMNGQFAFHPTQLPQDVPIAFEAVATTRNFLRGNFVFTQTQLAALVPPTIVSADRFLTHLLSWLAARGFRDLNTEHAAGLAMYDLIAHNHFVRVAGVTDIGLVLNGLRERGFNLDYYDFLGDTMLLAAIRDENIDFVTALLNAGVGTDVEDDFGETPMGLALETGNEELMEVLDQFIEQGSDEDEDKVEQPAIQVDTHPTTLFDPETPTNRTQDLMQLLDEPDLELLELYAERGSATSHSF